MQNILSQGVVPNFQNLNDLQFSNKISSLVFKSAVWGVPIGMFFHMNELSAHQVSVMLDALRSSGATLMSNSQLVNYLLGATRVRAQLTTQIRLQAYRRICVRGRHRHWWTRAPRSTRNTNSTCSGSTKHSSVGMGNRLASVCSGVWRAPANSALRQFLISGFWFQIRLVWPRYFGSR